MTDESETLAKALRGQGARLTGPRQAVWAVLVDSKAHLTAEEIHSQVTESGTEINLTSVYRALTLFDSLGLARQTRMGEAARWEVAHGDEVFHLVCRVCGEITHHGGTLVEQVIAHLRDDHLFDAEHVELRVTGVCGDCESV